jgi:hypothetical protein
VPVDLIQAPEPSAQTGWSFACARRTGLVEGRQADVVVPAGLGVDGRGERVCARELEIVRARTAAARRANAPSTIMISIEKWPSVGVDVVASLLAGRSARKGTTA